MSYLHCRYYRHMVIKNHQNHMEPWHFVKYIVVTTRLVYRLFSICFVDMTWTWVTLVFQMWTNPHQCLVDQQKICRAIIFLKRTIFLCHHFEKTVIDTRVGNNRHATGSLESVNWYQVGCTKLFSHTNMFRFLIDKVFTAKNHASWKDHCQKYTTRRINKLRCKSYTHCSMVCSLLVIPMNLKLGVELITNPQFGGLIGRVSAGQKNGKGNSG